MDLVIRNGLVVTEGGAGVTDIGVAHGRVVQLGGTFQGGDHELDATGLIVTPGGVDPHTHLTMPLRQPGAWGWCDDFESGTRAALAGGVTTVGNMSFPEDGSTVDGLALDLAEAERLALCDHFMHPIVIDANADNVGALDGLHADGHTSVKFFLSFPSFDRQVPHFVEVMRRVAALGGIALVHCEDAAVMGCCWAALRQQGSLGAEFFPDARPVQAESVAVHRAIGFAETTGCPTYVVHLSSRRALAACAEARSRGVPVFVETRPLYLHLTRKLFLEPGGARFAGAPPLRDQADVDALWAGLRFGMVDTVASDHAPWSLADKLDPERDATDLRQGVADLETCLPMLFSTGVLGGRLSLERFVALTSTTPAMLFGLYPRKGTIAVGADADLVVWDPDEVRVIDGAAMHSRADYSPYDGSEVRGWPRWTISRGEVVVDGREVRAEPGRGRLVRRASHRSR